MSAHIHDRTAMNRKGVTLLLSLIILATLTAAGIGASVLVINQYRAIRGTEEGIHAYYAADSGMEYALFTIFNHRLQGASLSNAETAVKGGVLPGVDLSQSTVGQTVADGSDPGTDPDSGKTFTKIPLNQTVQVDFESSFVNVVSPVVYISIQSDSLIAANPNTLAQVQWIYLPTQSVISPNFIENATTRIVNYVDAGPPGEIKINLTNGQVTPPGSVRNPSITPTGDPGAAHGWIVRIKALGSDLNNVILRAYRSDGTTLEPFKNDLIVNSRGSSAQGLAQTQLTAIIPWRIPTFGLFDYVIFSEGDIEKLD